MPFLGGSWGAASRPLTPPVLRLMASRRYYFELLHKQDDRGSDHVEVGVSAAAPLGGFWRPPCPALFPAAPPRTAAWTLPPTSPGLPIWLTKQLLRDGTCAPLCLLSSFMEKVALSRFLRETFTGRPIGERIRGARMNSWSQEQSSGTPSSLVARSGRASS